MTISSTPRAAGFLVITWVIAVLSYVALLPEPPKFVMKQTAKGWVQEPYNHDLRGFMALLFAVGTIGHLSAWTLVMRWIGGSRTSLAEVFRLACYCVAPLPIYALSVQVPNAKYFGLPFVGAQLALYGAGAARLRFHRNAWLGGVASVLATFLGVLAFLFAFLLSVSPVAAMLRSLSGD